MGRFENWRGAIDEPILELLTFGQNPFLNVLGTFFLILGPRDPVGNPSQPISRPCSIEIMYPCEWRIAIPASLMRVEKAHVGVFFNRFSDVFDETLPFLGLSYRDQAQLSRRDQVGLKVELEGSSAG